MIVENFDHTYNAPVAATDVSRLSEGTELRIRLTQPLSSKQAQPGQKFQAVLDNNIIVNGVTALKAGAPLLGEVVDVSAAGRAQGKGKMSIRLVSLTANGKTINNSQREYF